MHSQRDILSLTSSLLTAISFAGDATLLIHGKLLPGLLSLLTAWVASLLTLSTFVAASFSGLNLVPLPCRGCQG